MIHNDEELTVYRKQLTRVEDALASLRRDVLPKNKQNYEILAEAYLDEIAKFRTAIDAYLGIVIEPSEEQAPLTIALEGEGVGLGTTSVAVVTRVVDTFRKGLQSLVDVLGKVKRAVPGRRERWIERLCDFPLVGVGAGSVKIFLGDPPQESPLLADEDRRFLQQTIDLLFDGLEWAGQEEQEGIAPSSFAQLVAAKQQAVLSVVSRLLPSRSGAVRAVSFQRRFPSENRPARKARLGQEARERVYGEIRRLAADRNYSEAIGVIREVDLDKNTFTLRERGDQKPDLTCEYGEETEDAVKACLDCRVVVAGVIERSRKNQKETMEVETIELLQIEEEADTPAGKLP